MGKLVKGGNGWAMYCTPVPLGLNKHKKKNEGRQARFLGFRRG